MDADVDTVFGVPAVWSAAPAGLLALDGFSGGARIGVARFVASGGMVTPPKAVVAVDWRVAYSGEPTTVRRSLGWNVCRPVAMFDVAAAAGLRGLVFSGTADEIRGVVTAAARLNVLWSKVLPLIDRLERTGSDR